MQNDETAWYDFVRSLRTCQHNQCDQIWKNLATFRKLGKPLAIFWEEWVI